MKNKYQQGFTRNALASAIAFVYMGLTLAPAYASDTEIYTQTITAAATAPTVMMVLDTSGSMQWCIDSTSSSTCSDVSKQRINVLRSALNTVLLGKEGATSETTIAPAPGFVKMGYARFNPDANKGGWVRYPARPLDAFVEISPNGYVTHYGDSAKSDTVQTPSTPNGNAEATLTIAPSSDVGLSFSKVMVPKGATITEAYIELTAANTDSSSGDMLAKIEDNVNPVDYTSSGVNSRTYASTESFFTPSAWTKDQKYQIPVDTLVNDMVNKSTWCGGSNINFKITNKDSSSVQRKAYAFEAGEAVKPKLFVRYSIDPKKTDSCIKVTRSSTFAPKESADDAYYDDTSTSITNTNNEKLYVNFVATTETGKGKNKVTTTTVRRNIVRFPNVIVQQGASIKSAQLSAVSGSNSPVNNVYPISVEAFDADNVSPLCTGNSCPKPSYSLTSSLIWDIGSIPSTERKSFDVTSLAQSVVNRSGWASNNAMAFRLSNSTTTHNDNPVFATVDAASSKAMNLTIYWDQTVTNLAEFKTVRQDILDDLASLNVSGGTPLGAAYAEVSRYMLGMAPYVSYDDKGADVGGEVYEVHDSRVLNAAKTQFVSPVDTSGCSGNYIFMMSDGEPNNLANVGVNSKGITGETCDSGADVSGTGKQLNWKCMFDVAKWNVRSDNQIQVPVRTSTVYFGPQTSTNTTTQATIDDNIANMKTVASDGDGDAFGAGDEAALVEALTKTIKKAVDAGGTIAAPGVAVNQLNRLNHLDQLYYAVFDPKPQAYRWEGNLKRYRLSDSGDAIVDVNDDFAVDASTGFFKENTQSFWSATADGNKTVEGGAASMLPNPTDRRMFTYMGELTLKNQALTPIKLGDTSFDTAAKEKMGISDDELYTNLMNWYRGYDIPELDDDEVISTTGAALRKRMGGALHSQPVIANYGYKTDGKTAAEDLVKASEDPDYQKNVIFISTLEGTLHAIDAKTGVEKFSFIPGEKLATLMSHYTNPAQINPEFGMDLTWTFFRQDVNKNGQIGTGDKLHLYGGMRMGGDNYYALDVTDLDNPKLLFAIDGGSTGPYANMGQTWSQPVAAQVRIGGVTKWVLVFGGGYDDTHEVNALNNGTNNKGNQLYIVDAFTGDLIWFATGNSAETSTKSTIVADMKFSVPTAPNVVDLNFDGIADAIYFGDLGGQIFRADFNNYTTNASGLVKRVTRLAAVGNGDPLTTSTSHLRRFYEPPSVALFKDASGVAFATVAQGSGYRSHPLDTQIDEQFYVFFDYDVTKANLLTLEDGDLQSVILENNLAELDMASSDVKTNGVSVTGKQGWYVDFPELGEKSLAAALTFKGKLLFSTYTPVISGSKCSPVIGKTKLYTFCMPYGKLCANATSYVKDNVMVGLGGEPQLLVVKDPSTNDYKAVVITGTSVDDDIFNDVDVSPRFKTLQKWRVKTKK